MEQEKKFKIPKMERGSDMSYEGMVNIWSEMR